MVRASHKHILLVFTAAAFVLSGCTSSNIPTGNSFVGNVPDSISMTLSPTSTVDGGSVNAIIVVKDGLGNPVPDGTTVQLSVGPPAVGAFSTGTTISGSTSTVGGQAIATITAGSVTGSAIIEAVAGSVRATQSLGVTQLNAAVDAGTAVVTLGSITLVGTATTVPSDGTSESVITATLVGSDGARKAPASGEVIEVTFSTDLGVLKRDPTHEATVGGNPADTSIARSIKVKVDPSGEANVIYVASTSPGVATVTATSSGVNSSFSVAVFGTPSSIILDAATSPNPDPAEIAVRSSGRQETSKIFFQVLDQNGSAVLQSDTRTVEFMILNGGLGGGASVNPGIGVGAAITNGLARTVVRSGTRAGTLKVIAFVQTPTRDGTTFLEGSDLITTAASNTVQNNIFVTSAAYVGQNLKILFGPDIGTYTITAHNTVTGTLTLNRAIGSSATGLTFRVDNGRLDPGEVQTNAIEIGITGDLPSGENFSIVPDVLNIAGRVTVGLTDNLTAYLADRFNNSVHPGTSVSFTSFDDQNLSSSGQVLGADRSVNENSTAVTTLRSQAPLPSNGFVRVQAQSQTGPAGHVRVLAVDNSTATGAAGGAATATNSVLFAGTDGGGVFRSPNANPTVRVTPGAAVNFGNATPDTQWVQAGTGVTGLFNGIVNDIEIDPRDPSLIFAGTNDGVYRTQSAGEIWEDASGRGKVTGDTPTVVQTCVDNTGMLGGVPPCASQVGQIDLLLNFGSSQRRSKTKVILNNARTFNYSYVNERTIRLFNQPSVPTVTTITVDYELSGSLPSDTPITSVLASPTAVVTPRTVGGVLIDTGIVYASAMGDGVYRSTDQGFTWTKESAGLRNDKVQKIIYDSTNKVLYAATQGGGIYRSSLDDLQPNLDVNLIAMHTPLVWTEINGTGFTSLFFKDVRTIAIGGTTVGGVGGFTANVLVVGTRLGGVWVATDTGPTGAALVWSEANLNIQDVSSLLINTTITDLVVQTTGVDVAAGTAVVFASAVDDDDPQNIRGGVFRGVLTLAAPTLDFRKTGLGIIYPFDDTTATLLDKNVRSLALDTDLPNSGANQVLYAGTNGRNVFRRVLSDGAGGADPLTDTWQRINDRQNYLPSSDYDLTGAGALDTSNDGFLDFSLPAAIRNEVYDTTAVLFSGSTIVTVVQVSDSVRQIAGVAGISLSGPINAIPNGGNQTFQVTVSDSFGNPVVAGSTLVVTADNGTLAGDTNRTINDVQRSETEFSFTLINDVTTENDATVDVQVTSTNGAASTVISRQLLGPVEVTAGSLVFAVGGLGFPNPIIFTAMGGSNSGHYDFSVPGYGIAGQTQDTVSVTPNGIGDVIFVTATNVNAGAVTAPGTPAGQTAFNPLNANHYGNGQQGELTVTVIGP